MKRLSVMIGIILSLHVSEAIAQGKGSHYLIAGMQYGGLMGSGEAGNHFDKGTGFFVEWGVVEYGAGGTAIGTGVYRTTNRVGESSAEASFYVPFYIEGRGKFKKHPHYFWSFGIGWSRMHFEGTNDSDNQGFISAGVGRHIRLGEKGILQATIKPYMVFWNSLEQRWGIEANMGIGFTWEK